MNLTFKWFSIKLPILVIAFFLLNAGLCLTYSIDIVLGRPYQLVTRLVNLDGESNLASWYSSTQLFCVFILSAFFSYHKMKENGKLSSIILLPLTFLLMSIDESAQIHEELGILSDVIIPSGSRVGTSFHKTGVWMFVIGLPFFALFLLLLNSIKRQFSGNLQSLKKLIIGMVVLLTGALGFELISNFIDTKFYQIEVLIEEGLEMTGVTIMLWATYEMALEYFKPYQIIK